MSERNPDSGQATRDPLDFSALKQFLGDADEAPKLREAVDRLTRTVREQNAKIAAVVTLCRDPETSHLPLSRIDVLRLLR